MIRYISLRLLVRASRALAHRHHGLSARAHRARRSRRSRCSAKARAPKISQQLRHALGLDLPLPVQYGHYLARHRSTAISANRFASSSPSRSVDPLALSRHAGTRHRRAARLRR